MRFRKRISISKGSHINLSKSGVSFSTGVKGLSTSVGKRGVYLNTSIPGTGLYSRTKIGGGSTSKKNSKSYARSSHATAQTSQQLQNVTIRVDIDISEDGVITVTDTNSGNVITDAYLLKAIKDSPEYKEEVLRLTEERVSEYEQRMLRITNIQEFTPVVLSTEAWVQRIQSMVPQEYKGNQFEEPAPTMEDVERDLAEEADRTITTGNWLKKKKLKERYINDTKNIEYNSRCEEWLKRKDAFELHEKALKKTFDKEEAAKLEKRKEQCMQLVEGDEKTISIVIENWLKHVAFDFDFNLEYEFSDGILFVDLDLPEIEELPTKKVQKMANGIAKIKPKSAKEIKEDYSKCVFGLALFFAGNLFNKALNVQEIVISGYTQRRNKSGDIVDDYIFSVCFDRQTIMNIDYHNGDPKGNCMMFKNRVLQNVDSSFKAIKPFSVEDCRG